MKQILQNLRTGETELAEVPCPRPGRGQVLIQTRASVISPGTERMLVEFSQASLIQKARQQPERVKQVLDKMRTDGLLPTLEAVFRKLDEPLPLGYCNAGTVLKVGEGVHDLHPGDRVASNGPHAEIVCVPRNLCAKVPDRVSDEHAAFTALGSIAIQGVRLVQPTLGERFVVFGVGVVGLLTVQLLRASGCAVLAVDRDAARLAVAESCGARVVNIGSDDPVVAAEAWTEGQGVDGAIIAASAKSDAIMHQAAESCRKRGRIVLVGVVGLDLKRDDFYRKELSFQVSCSYGPGRYDEAYEQGGHDYPVGFVRWTERRNFEAVLGAIEAEDLQLAGIVTHRFPFSDALSAYKVVQGSGEALGVVLEYPGAPDRTMRVEVREQRRQPRAGHAVVAVIGAGEYARGILLPALAKAHARLAYVADVNALAAKHYARKFGGERAVTDYKMILEDPAVDAAFVLVGHHLHAKFVVEALEAGKHVFVEKPLAMNENELRRVEDAFAGSEEGQLVMLGFNRRFSPHIVKIRKLLAGRKEPLCMSITVNGGPIPPDHWTQDPERGGGRIIGEGCHFIDLLAFIAGSRISAVSAAMVGGDVAVRDDKMAIVLRFEDGSIGTVNYFSNGSKRYPKETLEIFSDGRVLRMENHRVTRGYGFRGFRRLRTLRQDKGHQAEVAAFLNAVEIGGASPIPFEEIVNSTQATLVAVDSARTYTTRTL